MKLNFSGAPEITAPRAVVWSKLLDADFVAASAPGVESVERVDADALQGDLRARRRRRSRSGSRSTWSCSTSSRASGSRCARAARPPAPNVDVVSALQVEDAGNGHTRLNWSATSDVSGTVASVGAPAARGHRAQAHRAVLDRLRAARQRRLTADGGQGRRFHGWHGRRSPAANAAPARMSLVVRH